MRGRNDLSRALQLTADNAAIYVIRREQAAEERRAQSRHAEPPGQRLHKLPQLPSLAAEDLKARLIACRGTLYDSLREGRDIRLAGLTVYILYKLSDTLWETAKHRAAQRARLAASVGTAHTMA